MRKKREKLKIQPTLYDSNTKFHIKEKTGTNVKNLFVRWKASWYAREESAIRAL